MAKNTILENVLRGKVPDGAENIALDDLRSMLEVMLARIMEAEVTARVAADRYERSDDRSGYRNGTRARRFDTRLGTIDLRVPKLRSGGYVPAFLEERSRSERALVSVVQQAVNGGVATRRVEKIFAALGIAGISKSQVSEMCQELDEMATAFRERPLTKPYPYLMLDAMYEKVRVDKHVVSQAVVVAYGVGADGLREVIGDDVVASESLESWQTFLRRLKERGLHGVRLVASDAHAGLKSAIAAELTGAAWQRCKVHFMRNVLAHVSHGQKEAFAADLKSIFAQPNGNLAEQRLAAVVAQYRRSAGRAVSILEDGGPDALVLRLPDEALAENRDDQSRRTSQSRYPPSHARCRHISEHRVSPTHHHHPPHRRDGGLVNRAPVHGPRSTRIARGRRTKYFST